MDDPRELERMRSDWNERAGEDAYYYVAFGRREQEDDEFFATGKEIVTAMEMELKRLRAREAALEIGCGPGRLMRPLARHFAEIHGVDVSDKMIRLAKERLRDTSNAFPHHGSGADLRLFPDEKFDFVYSYAVFQHIPSRDVVLEYLREARRVLKTDGILRCQINGLPKDASPKASDRVARYNTWSGVRFSPDEIAQFAADHDFQLLAVEQIWTQYMWITCRKRPAGWTKQLRQCQVAPNAARIRNMGNASTGETVAPGSGLFASLAVFVYNLPAECDINYLTLNADGKPCRPTFIGEPERDGASQVNGTLPDGLRTGLVPVDLQWMGQPLCPPSWIRIVPPGPLVPRIMSLSDAVNLLSGTRIVSGLVKVTMREVVHPETFRASVDGHEAPPAEFFCVDPIVQKFEFNFRLPQAIGKGPHQLRARLGRREFAPLAIEVA
ncbi:MAG TPA: class I SAM-dependent methyltransferase [Verrucomicrobiae bacterium]|nr:class I SAM-dependent methyltransferase [Verrucomicrobiae bacterium]